MNLKVSLDFLRDLSQNNSRDWFNTHKARYQEAKEAFDALIHELIPIARYIDPLIDVENPAECSFRIYRDTRFSKNKDPYKTNFGAFIAPGGRKSAFSGYYIHLQPGESFSGGGIYHPEPRFLNAVRRQIHEHPDEFGRILQDPLHRKFFDRIYGDKLKKVPRDYPKDHPHGEWLKFKDYALFHSLSDELVCSDRIVVYLEEMFRAQAAFNTFMNRAVMKEMG